MAIEQVHDLDINKVMTSKLNPRLDLGDLSEMTESIRRKGVEEPLIVRKKDDKWEVIIGERRFQASKKAGQKTVPCIVRKYTDNEAIEVSLIENVMRKELNPIERGTAIKYLLNEYKEKYPNQGTLAYALGVSQSTISVWLSILDLDETVQKLVGTEEDAREGKKIPVSMVQVLKSRIQDPAKQKQWIDRALTSGWGTPELQRELDKMGAEKRNIKVPIFISLETSAFFDVLEKKKVTLDQNTRTPDVGEIINITTPRVRQKVTKVSKNGSGKTIVEFAEAS